MKRNRAMEKAVREKWYAETMLANIDREISAQKRRRRIWNKRLGDALREMTRIATEAAR
jgi:hypothetical protein